METFATSSEGLRFLCPECQHIHFIENKANLDKQETGVHASPYDEDTGEPEPTSDATKPATPVPPLRGEQKICPKCGHAQSGGTSCHKCGLDFLRFDPANLPPDPVEAALIWSRIEHDPQDQALHEQFLNACNKAGRLDYATKQYRILSRLPGMANLSQRMQARILSLAQAQIMPGGLEATPRDNPKTKSKILVWLLLLLSLGGIGYLIYASSKLLEKMY